MKRNKHGIQYLPSLQKVAFVLQGFGPSFITNCTSVTKGCLHFCRFYAYSISIVEADLFLVMSHCKAPILGWLSQASPDQLSINWHHSPPLPAVAGVTSRVPCGNPPWPCSQWPACDDPKLPGEPLSTIAGAPTWMLVLLGVAQVYFHKGQHTVIY